MQTQSKFLIWVVLAFSVAVLAALALMVFAMPSSSSPAGLPEIAGGQTAHQARSVVEAWGATWADDAAIVNCSTVLRRGSKDIEGWNVQVYSSMKQRIALLRVRHSDVQLLREVAALYPQIPLPAAAWRYDSSQILSRWWKGPGAEVWSRAQSEAVYVYLGTTPAGEAVWQVSVTEPKGQSLHFWELRADGP